MNIKFKRSVKKFTLLSIFIMSLSSCGSSDSIVNIYQAYEYNCTKDEFRILKNNQLLLFLKEGRWYSREQFHEANYKYAIKPYKDIPISKKSLAEIAPTEEISNDMFNEMIMGVDCENPKDLLY